MRYFAKTGSAPRPLSHLQPLNYVANQSLNSIIFFGTIKRLKTPISIPEFATGSQIISDRSCYDRLLPLQLPGGASRP